MSNDYFGTPAEIEAARKKRRLEIKEHAARQVEEATRIKLYGGQHMRIGTGASDVPVQPVAPREPVVLEKPVSRPPKDVEPELVPAVEVEPETEVTPDETEPVEPVKETEVEPVDPEEVIAPEPDIEVKEAPKKAPRTPKAPSKES